MVRRVLTLILWAVFALPLWHLLAALPAAPFIETAPGPMLILGFIAATLVAYLVDRRVVKAGGPRQWRVPRGWMLGAAFVAGCGVTILGSELGNIALTWSAELREPIVDRLQITPWIAAILGGLVHPVCLMLVVNDIVHRAFRVVHKPKTAMAFTIALGAMSVGWAAMPQTLALLALPAWLYRHTQVITLSVAAYLPVGLVAALVALDLGPGIPGFDVVGTDRVLWQPIWFDVLGAVLVAAGVAPFLRAWTPREPEPTR